MTGEINPALDDALRELGRPTTPDDLARRGVRRLRSVGMREVSLLIERAVNRTLMSRTQRVSERELADLVETAQADFSTQLRGLQDLSDSRELVERHKQEWRSSLESLRRAVSRRRGFLEMREAHVDTRDQARHDALRRELKTAMAPLAALAPPRAEAGAPLLDRVADRMVAMLETVLVEERGALQRKHDEELGLLERRLEKLVRSLEQTEQALARAASARAADLGISSVYREVQGLGVQERDRELKKALMARIFEANLALREAGAGGDAQAQGAGTAEASD